MELDRVRLLLLRAPVDLRRDDVLRLEPLREAVPRAAVLREVLTAVDLLPAVLRADDLARPVRADLLRVDEAVLEDEDFFALARGDLRTFRDVVPFAGMLIPPW